MRVDDVVDSRLAQPSRDTAWLAGFRLQQTRRGSEELVRFVKSLMS